VKTVVNIAEYEAEQKEAKTRFAIAMLAGSKTEWEIAKEIAPNDQFKILTMSKEWPSDPEVMAIQKALVQEYGHEAFLPTPEETARDVYRISRSCFDPEVKLKALELYAKLRNQLSPGGVQVNIQNNDNRTLTQSVMFVQDFGDDETWEKKLAAQQRRLKNGDI